MRLKDLIKKGIVKIKKKRQEWRDYKNMYINLGDQLRKEYDEKRAKETEVKNGNKGK